MPALVHLTYNWIGNIERNVSMERPHQVAAPSLLQPDHQEAVGGQLLAQLVHAVLQRGGRGLLTHHLQYHHRH